MWVGKTSLIPLVSLAALRACGRPVCTAGDNAAGGTISGDNADDGNTGWENVPHQPELERPRL